MVALAVLSVGSHLGRPATPPLFPTSRQHPVPRSRRRTVRATDSKLRDESGTSARQFTRSAWVGTSTSSAEAKRLAVARTARVTATAAPAARLATAPSCATAA